MTESNTPPENQKKKSAFSRFFSRKKSKDQSTTEELQPISNNKEPQPITGHESQPVTDKEPKPVTDKESQLISNKEPRLATDRKSDQHKPTTDSTSNDTLITDKLSTHQEAAVAAEQGKPLNDNIAPPIIEQDNVTEIALPNSDTAPEQNTEVALKLNADTLSTDIELAPTTPPSQNTTPIEPTHNTSTETIQEEATVEEGLNKSRTSFFKKISNVFKGSFNLDDELFDELEEILITSDIGIETSLSLVEKLRARVKADKIQDANGVIEGLRKEVANMLEQSEQDWTFSQSPYVILMVGVNGAGKTTTTAKIAKHFQDQGKSVMLAAADTFRAAAVEQLQEWGKRLNIPVVAQTHGSDAAAVAHDALTSAKARNIDVLMIDTAGRLHTQSDLMEQLQKVNRVLAKIDPSTPHEVMQVLDSGTGQNALAQLDHFQKAVGVSSICLSKLDGSAKGGIAISLSEKYKLPIRFIGVGEGFNDIKSFSATQFANALIPDLNK